MEIDYRAPQQVTDVISSLGRTEDLKFSPNNKLLAIVGFAKNKITICNINIDKSAGDTEITLTDAFELYSDQLNEPHGVDFLDEETIIVTNRGGNAIFLKLPADKSNGNIFNLAPLEIIRSDETGLLHGPSAASIFRIDQKLCEVLICNNYSDQVTRHLVDLTVGCVAKSNQILLKKWLFTPDGVCLSGDGRWIAISNYNRRSVFLYEYTSSLNSSSEPDGILRCVSYPHGVQFTSDGRFLLVADGGAPYVHVYRKINSTWRGVHNPIRSFRVMNDEDFIRGRSNPQEGGPKGIDVDNAMNVFAVTCEHRPLVFFDLKAMLESTRPHPFDPEENEEGYFHEQKELEVRYELEMIKEIEERAQN